MSLSATKKRSLLFANAIVFYCNTNPIGWIGVPPSAALRLRNINLQQNKYTTFLFHVKSSNGISR